MQLFPWTNVTICGHFHRLMTLTLWRTSTPSLLMPLPPQVCSVHSLHSNYRTSSHTAHAQSVISQILLFLCFIIPVSISTSLSSGFYSCNTEIMPGIYNWTSGVQVTPHNTVHRLQQTFCCFHLTVI